MRKIVVNKIKCNYCGDIIESKSVHDFKFCKCGAVAVDGGHEYLRRCFKEDPKKDFEDMSEYKDFPDEGEDKNDDDDLFPYLRSL